MLLSSRLGNHQTFARYCNCTPPILAGFGEDANQAVYCNSSSFCSFLPTALPAKPLLPTCFSIFVAKFCMRLEFVLCRLIFALRLKCCPFSIYAKIRYGRMIDP